MRRTSPVLMLLGLALLAEGAAAQPCIQCSDCTDSYCWQNCQPSCASAPSPNNIIVNGDACRAAGVAYAPTAAQGACRTTELYCNGGSQPSAANALGAIGPTTLSQCSNIALGSCQQTANSVWHTPCGWRLAFGYAQCTAQQFRQFYEGETSATCSSWATTVTGVTPGSNQFAGGSSPFGNRRLLATV
ncbi:MAG: hypothetical protein J3K34DRAFT_469647 [Monoraphidium minutum]|nr:MAG: hypothetical protein J3K34DRAFT_469647 [Monoraphidium minutum]